ncbi:hypothetical protein RRG08_064301 [Elysia crispata]|uniref:Uncharacterized protein n=1 Tax=Elysia crispata TaxID=231223 RepID=A0AAE1B309_9GAST|nr:hypothetical protein RRG08_064301 [Elysia crispata]KAK3798740.1 hypothetical protein RRG08_064301 [Elysia crispata]
MKKNVLERTTARNGQKGKVKKADAIIVFLRYTPSPAEPELLFDILGSGRADWRLAFRATAHVGASAYHAYLDAKNAPTLTQRACKTLDFGKPCASHYRNSAILDNWSNIHEVLVAVVDYGKIVKKARFRGKGTTYLSWFGRHEYLDSSWTDLVKEKTNFFSIRADDRNFRRFFINHLYAGCAKDIGWLVVAENLRPRCSWEKNGEIPVIKYATGHTKENWTYGKVKFADAILIFVKVFPPRGFPEEYFDVLGSGTRDWRLAFRGTASVGKSLFLAYLDGRGIPAVVKPACKNLDFKWPCDSHYRNSHALDNWSNIQEVLVAIVDDGVVVKTIRFSGRRSTFLNWFGAHFILESPWADLRKVKQNFFSIRGDDINHRRFFINNQYAGCEKDIGWLVVVERSRCPWEKDAHTPIIKYAAGQTRENWTKGQFRNADAILVFLKYPPGPGLPEEYFDVLECGLKEWRLAFRGTAGVGTSVYDAYVEGKNVPALVQPACKTMNWNQPCHSHYRNSDALDNWFNVHEVLLGVVDGGSLVKIVRFDGHYTTFVNWFDQGRYLKSSWSDLFLQETNFFSLAGDPYESRRFFMSFTSDACAKASGWLVAVDALKPKGCAWEKTGKFPILKYAAGPKLARWASEKARDADAIVVFIKYAK